MRSLILAISVVVCASCRIGPEGLEIGRRRAIEPVSRLVSNWPGWRGGDGRGVSDERGLPAEWTPSHTKWKTALAGRGHSSPIVWGDYVFLTTAVEGDAVAGHRSVAHTLDGKPFLHPDAVSGDRRQTLKVLAFEASTGKPRWDVTAYDGPMYDSRHRRSSFASSTPVTDGERVYVTFGAEGTYAYDFSGKLAWKADLGRIRTLGLGYASSPVLFENAVILVCDDDEGEKSFIAALDRRTGQEVWRTARRVTVSWSTPVLVRAGGETQLVVAGSEHTIGYDPRTGREVWRARGVNSNAIPSPVFSGDVVIISAGFPEKRVLAYRLKPGAPPDLLWEFSKGTAYVPSPILYAGLLYLTTDNGILTCLDAQSGAVRYEGGRLPVPATFFASPVAVDGLLLMASERGDVFVIRAGPEHKVVAQNSVGEAVFGSPAIANGRIFIRTVTHLMAIGK